MKIARQTTLILLGTSFFSAICGAGTLPPPTMVPEIDVEGTSPPVGLRLVGDSILFSGPGPSDPRWVWRLRDGAANPIASTCEEGTPSPAEFVQLPGPTVALLVEGCWPGPFPFLARYDDQNGTVVPIVATTPPLPDYAVHISRLGDRALVTYEDDSLWATDGSDQGTLLIHGQAPFDLKTLGGPSGDVRSVGTWAILTRYFDNEARAWRTDATTAGTWQLSQVARPQAMLHTGGQEAAIFYPLGTRTVFVGLTREEGSEIWSTDGTPLGTMQISNLTAGDINPSMSNLVACGGVAYFSAYGEVPGGGTPFNLWRTDGTAEGTYAIGELSGTWTGLAARPIGCLGPSIILLRELPGTFYLAISDGTLGGTVNLLEVTTDFWFNAPGVEYHGWLFFSAELGEDGPEIWATNGTPEGTFKTADVAPGEAGAFPRQLTPLGDSIYFIANDHTHHDEIWRLVVDPVLVFRDGFETATLTAWSQPAP